MGSRTGPYMCQRTSSFVRHIMQNLLYFVANYVDDFMGIESPKKVWQAYYALGNLLRDLGISEAHEKAVPPTYIIEFLGVLYNFLKMTISVTPERLYEIQMELNRWRTMQVYTRKQLESLLGKLQFVSNCVRPGRVMVLRLRRKLVQSERLNNTMTESMWKDLQWWKKFMEKYNGTSIMWMQQIPQQDALIATDACLTGIGGTGPDSYFYEKIPDHICKQTRFQHCTFRTLCTGDRNKAMERQATWN